MAADVEVIIYDSAITAMSLPGGQVWRYGFQKARRTERLAKANVRSRSGYLASQIHAFYEGSQRDQATMVVSADTEYAAAVHEGSGDAEGLIHPTHHRFLRIDEGGGFGVSYHRSVRGQRANPFLTDALEAVIGTL